MGTLSRRLWQVEARLWRRREVPERDDPERLERMRAALEAGRRRLEQLRAMEQAQTDERKGLRAWPR